MATGLLLTGCAPAAAQHVPNETEVLAVAAKCGLAQKYIRFTLGQDGVKEWMVSEASDGNYPDPRSMICFAHWGMKQRGVRIGFISEPPPKRSRP